MGDEIRKPQIDFDNETEENEKQEVIEKEIDFNHRVCPKCGNKIHIRASICPNCGIKKEPTTKTTTANEKKHNWIIVLILAILIIAAVTVAVFIVGQEKEEIDNEGTIVLDEEEIIKNEVIEITHDFQNSNWGDSKIKVKKANTDLNFIDIGEALCAETKVAGMDARIYFDFEDGKLVSGTIKFEEKHSNSNNYIKDYGRVKELLENKYGRPETEGEIWENDLFKDDPEDYGLAVAAEHLVYVSEWITDSSRIIMGLSGDNYKIAHMINYSQIGHETKVDDSKL